MATSDAPTPEVQETPASQRATPVEKDRAPAAKAEVPVAKENAVPSEKSESHWKGRQVDQFRLQRMLGTGAMSVVIQAEDVNLNRTVALKFLKKHVKNLDQAEQVEQFFREAKCAAALEHPCIVRIYGLQQHQGRWYLIMEHMEGGSLLQLVHRAGPLNPRRACMFLADAASGIAEAHNAGIIHRDIKPSNLLLTRAARCKVADFGLVKPNIENDTFRLSTAPVGSRHFLAPEILRGEEQTTAVDVYSLAATLYMVMAGRPPFPADDAHELGRMVLESPPPNIREFVPHANFAVADLIIHSLAKNPKVRPTAAEFCTILRGELSDMTESLSRTDGSSSIGVQLEGSAIPSPATSLGSAVGAPAPAPAAAIPSPIANPQSSVTLSATMASHVMAAGSAVMPVQPQVVHSRTNTIALIIAAAALIVATVMLVSMRGSSNPPANAPQPSAAGQTRVVELASLKSRIDVLYERVSRMDGSQGLRLLIDQAAALHGEIAGLSQTEQGETALAKSKTLLELCQRIDVLDSQRTAALSRGKEAAAAMDHARSAGATMQSGSPLAAAVELQRTAAAHVAASQFQEAVDDYVKSIAQSDAALTLAKAKAADDAAIAAARQKEQVIHEARTLRDRAADLLMKAKASADVASANSAMEFVDKALALNSSDEVAIKLKTEIAAFLARKPGDRYANSVGMIFSFCPAGVFPMGSPASESGRDEDENQVRVTITRPFYLARTEVTQSQWKSVMGDAYVSPDGAGDGAMFLGPDMPVQEISWNDAVAFCKRLSALEHRTYRLPTEAEWEYACRAGSTTPFHVGDDLTAEQAQVDGTQPYRGKMRGKAAPRPQRVASFPPNAWNIYDMHGNVAEWCADWYAPYAVGDATDPRGPAQPSSLESANRVVRGGSWCHPPRTARSASRWSNSPVVKTNYIGFRVLLEIEDSGDQVRH